MQMRIDALTKWLFGVEIAALAFLAVGIAVPAETTWIVGFAGGGVVGALVIFAVARRERSAIDMVPETHDSKSIEFYDRDGSKWTGHVFLTGDDE
jgi:hypothetical protein